MPNLRTPLCDRLGIEHPVISAPISASPGFVSAVSNAGGLGMIQGTWLEVDDLRDAIAETRRLTDRPFGANFVLSLTAEDGHAKLDAALEAGVPVISTSWADPTPVIRRIQDAGAFALHTVGSAEEAQRVVDLGIDAVVAQGVEAGGHVWGEIATMVLVPTVVDAVPDSHVIAAGGIADGRGLAAVLALGAEAAWVGTRFLLASECASHPAYREKLKAARATDTVLSKLFDGGWPDAPHRCLSNSTLEAWRAAGRPEPGRRPNEGEIIAYDPSGRGILRYSLEDPLIGMSGEVASMALYAGQSAGLTNEEKPAAKILHEMVADAAAILSRLAPT